jgi:hypothetical protein
MEFSIWGFPVFKYKFDDPDKALEEILKNANDETLDEMSEDWNAKCKSTAATRNSVTLLHIREELENCLGKFSKDVHIPKENMNFNGCSNLQCTSNDCVDYWINVYKKGDHQDIHYHMNQEDEKTPLFSFTYFAKYDPEKDAKFYFHNPSPAPHMYEEFSGCRPEFKPQVELNISQGEVIFFPPFLLHSVDEQTSDDPRVTLAGNVYR